MAVQVVPREKPVKEQGAPAVAAGPAGDAEEPGLHVRTGAASTDSSILSSDAGRGVAANHRTAASRTGAGTVPFARREQIRSAASLVDVRLVSTQKSADAAYWRHRRASIRSISSCSGRDVSGGRGHGQACAGWSCGPRS